MRRPWSTADVRPQPAAETVLAVGILSAHTVALFIDRLRILVMSLRSRLKAIVLIGLVALVVSSVPLGVRAQGSDDLATLNRQMQQLYGAGKYADATEIATQSLALGERQFGPDHPEVGNSLNDLAFLYTRLGRYSEAEPLYKRALAIREKALGSDHVDVGRRSTIYPCCTLNWAATARPSRFARAQS